jgi:hypothetical protein
LKRADASSCTYAAPGTRKKNQTSQGFSSSDDMQNRIDRLEGLVLSLMTNGAQASGPSAAYSVLSAGASTGSAEYGNDVDIDATDKDDLRESIDEDESDVDQVVSSLGSMKVDATKSLYFGDAHWATILTDVSFLRRGF